MNTNLFFFLNIIKTIYSLYFTYPTAITLNNGNIFIIHKSGITICNANFTQIIANTLIIDLIPTLNDLYKIKISKFEDGYFLCLIINKLNYC